MNAEASSPAPSAPPPPRQKCPKCAGVIDPVTGACPWCATPEVFAPPPPRKESARMPSPLVWVLGIVGVVMVVAALLLPSIGGHVTSPQGTAIKMPTVNPLSVFLFVPGMFLLIIAGAKHYMDS